MLTDHGDGTDVEPLVIAPPENPPEEDRPSGPMIAEPIPAASYNDATVVKSEPV